MCLFFGGIFITVVFSNRFYVYIHICMYVRFHEICMLMFGQTMKYENLLNICSVFRSTQFHLMQSGGGSVMVGVVVCWSTDGCVSFCKICFGSNYEWLFTFVPPIFPHKYMLIILLTVSCSNAATSNQPVLMYLRFYFSHLLFSFFLFYFW